MIHHAHNRKSLYTLLRRESLAPSLGARFGADPLRGDVSHRRSFGRDEGTEGTEGREGMTIRCRVIAFLHKFNLAPL